MFKIAGLILLIAAAVGCGGTDEITEPKGTPSPDPIELRTELDGVQTKDGLPTAISIKTDAGKLLLWLGPSIDLTEWGVQHLEGHLRSGFTLRVTYIESPGEFLVTELND